MRIESIYTTGKDFTFMPQILMTRYHLWPWLWAQIFKFLNISDPFAWPYIIHVTQTLILSSSLFFFCWVAYGILLHNNKYRLTLAFISMIFWIFGTGTFSMQYQQAWIMWYSVNYQCISMSILWLNLGLTILVLYSDISLRKKIILSCIITTLFILGLFFHSMEMGFYLMFLMILACFKINKIPKVSVICKRNLFLCGGVGFVFLIIITVCGWLILNGTIYTPWKGHLNKINKISDVYMLIELYSWILRSVNRFPSSFSELALFSLGMGVLSFIFIIKAKHRDLLENRRLFFSLLFLAFLFFIIPVFPIINGIFALLTKMGVVYRFFYVSPWFLFIPLTIYFLCHYYCQKTRFSTAFVISNLTIFLLCLICSKLFLYSALDKNTISIINSFNKDKVGCQYTNSDIGKLKTIIANTENKLRKKNNVKSNLYHIRGDWAPVLASLPSLNAINYNRLNLTSFPNISYSKRFVKKYKKYSKSKSWKYYKRYHAYKKIIRRFKDYNLINLELPSTFPRDESIFETFPRIEKPRDKVVKVEKVESLSDGIDSFIEIKQTFNKVGRIARIQLMFNRPENATKDIILKIKEKNTDKTLAQQRVNASEIKDQKWYTFKFPDYVYLNPKKTYYISLESPESYPGNAVSVYIGDGSQYKNGELYINGKQTDKDLCMKIWKGY